jgi:SAM-dependent MidA family methyltransferase
MLTLPSLLQAKAMTKTMTDAYCSFMPQNAELNQRLIQAIQYDKTNSISFAHFMEIALYYPQYGYYTAGLNKLGEKGDFVTAPEISPLFAQCLGRQYQQVFFELGACEILEIGAGTGKMAGDLLLFLEKNATLPTHYKILEISPNLRQRQQEFLKEQVPHLFSLIEWLEDWPATPITGFVIANEVVDALPVHKFLWTTCGVEEMRVTQDKNNFAWVLAKVASTALAENLMQLKHDYFKTIGKYESEVCLKLAAWVERLSQALKQGLILIIDYGFPAHTYYHPDRSQGTLKCYYQHKSHANPFILIGSQDITALVDFSLLAQCAVNTGLAIAGFNTQAAFLLNTGLLQNVEECYTMIPSIDVNRQVYWLTSPNEMGELVKVIGLTRGYEATKIQGFLHYDKQISLSMRLE